MFYLDLPGREDGAEDLEAADVDASVIRVWSRAPASIRIRFAFQQPDAEAGRGEVGLDGENYSFKILSIWGDVGLFRPRTLFAQVEPAPLCSLVVEGLKGPITKVPVAAIGHSEPEATDLQFKRQFISNVRTVKNSASCRAANSFIFILIDKSRLDKC